jgi:Leu/Phe-tRNA-protein transferase
MNKIEEQLERMKRKGIIENYTYERTDGGGYSISMKKVKITENQFEDLKNNPKINLIIE